MLRQNQKASFNIQHYLTMSTFTWDPKWTQTGWNLKPLWKVVPFTWQFHCGNLEISYRFQNCSVCMAILLLRLSNAWFFFKSCKTCCRILQNYMIFWNLFLSPHNSVYPQYQCVEFLNFTKILILQYIYFNIVFSSVIL